MGKVKQLAEELGVFEQYERYREEIDKLKAENEELKEKHQEGLGIMIGVKQSMEEMFGKIEELEMENERLKVENERLQKDSKDSK